MEIENKLPDKQPFKEEPPVQETTIAGAPIPGAEPLTTVPPQPEDVPADGGLKSGDRAITL